MIRKIKTFEVTDKLSLEVIYNKENGSIWSRVLSDDEIVSKWKKIYK